MFDQLPLFAATQSISWHLLPMALVISLVYSASRFEMPEVDSPPRFQTLHHHHDFHGRRVFVVVDAFQQPLREAIPKRTQLSHPSKRPGLVGCLLRTSRPKFFSTMERP